MSALDEVEGIRLRRTSIQKRIKAAEGAVLVVKAELKALQHECDHVSSHEFTGSCMGETCTTFKCEDCGLERSS
jgi:hypothetical protein